MPIMHQVHSPYLVFHKPPQLLVSIEQTLHPAKLPWYKQEFCPRASIAMLSGSDLVEEGDNSKGLRERFLVRRWRRQWWAYETRGRSGLFVCFLEVLRWSHNSVSHGIATLCKGCQDAVRQLQHFLRSG
jgi:hypothetical protein